MTNGTAHIFEDKSALDRLSGRRGGRIPKAFYDGRFPMAPRILKAADRAFRDTLQGEKFYAARIRRGDRLPWGFEECTSPPSAAAKIVAAATPLGVRKVFVMSDEPPRKAVRKSNFPAPSLKHRVDLHP